MEIRGRVVVITGGGGGIGGALGRRFKAEGAQAIVVSDINREAAERAAKEVDGIPIVADVSDEHQVQALVREAIESCGRIDLYCSNAGVAFGGGEDAEDAAWQQSWSVNVMAHVYAARAALPGMLARHDGYFLGTISAAGLLNHILAAPYAATKAAALSFMEWLAIAYRDQGIRVSALCPQGVKTAMLARAGEGNFLQAGALTPEQVADAVICGLRNERFLILPHPDVHEYFGRKATDYDRWLNGMRRLRSHVLK